MKKSLWLAFPILILGLGAWRVKVSADSWKPRLLLKTQDGYCLARLSPDGHWMALGYDSRNELEDLTTGTRYPIKGKAGIDHFSPDGRLAFGSNFLDTNNPVVEVWETASRKLIKSVHIPLAEVGEGMFADTAINSRGELLVLTGGKLRVWPLTGQGKLQKYVLSPAPRGEIEGNVFSDDGKLLAICSTEKSRSFVQMWDANTRKLLREYNIGQAIPADSEIVISSKHGLMAVTDGSTSLRSVYDLHTGRELWHRITPFVCFTSDESQALTAGTNLKKLQVLDARTGNIIRTVGPLPVEIFNVVATLDGNNAICSGEEGGLFEVRIR